MRRVWCVTQDSPAGDGPRSGSGLCRLAILPMRRIFDAAGGLKPPKVLCRRTLTLFFLFTLNMFTRRVRFSFLGEHGFSIFINRDRT